MNQLFAAYARGKEAKELAVILGEGALTEEDKAFASLQISLRIRMCDRESVNRTVKETLIRLDLLTMIPVKELKRVRDAYIEKYLNPRLHVEETNKEAVSATE